MMTETETAFGLRHDLRAVKVVLHRELLRFRQDKVRLVAALFQPVLFLFVLGTGLSPLTRGGTAGLNLRTFLFPGVLTTSTLLTALMSSVSIVWDREFGFLREMLVAPIRRGAILVGKCLGGATVATLQSLVVMLLAPFAHVTLSIGLVLELVPLLFVLSFAMAALGQVIAARIKQLQAVMGVLQMLVLPMSFLSGALYPVGDLPAWLRVLVLVNPLTYAVHPVRALVFSHIGVSPVAIRLLNPPITWFGWRVSDGAQVAVVCLGGLVLLTLASIQFSRTD